MSVNKHLPSLLDTIICQTQDYISQQLRQYSSFLSESHNQIQNTISIIRMQQTQQQQRYENIIQELYSEIAQLKEDNSNIRNQYMLNCISFDQISQSKEKLMRENNEKDERVKYLAEEVETIKRYMNQLKNMQDSQNVVDFDQGEETPPRFDGLQVIKQVSQHDLSMTMSFQSFQSSEIGDDHSLKTHKTQHQSQEAITEDIQNYQIENYHDALEIFKNYNSGNGAKMLKKDKSETISFESHHGTELKVCQPLKPQHQKRVGNETINKIKKMRKIDDAETSLPFESRRNSNPRQAEQKQCDSVLIISKVQHRLQNGEIKQRQESSTSINSNRFESRVKKELLNLEQDIKRVFQIIHHINAANSHSLKTNKIKDSYSKITYVGGLQYKGHCDQQGLPSGYGKLLLNQQTVYQGQWRFGKFHGWGKLILLPFIKAGQKVIIELDGNFREGLVFGSVICIFSNGERFMGNISNECIEKQGTFVSEKGIMTGHWENSRLIYLI